jgi:hypothetical protein
MTAGLTSANGGSFIISDCFSPCSHLTLPILVSPMQLGQHKSASNTLSPLARSFTPGSAPGRQNVQFLPDAPPSASALDSAAILAQQRQRLNASRANQQLLAVPASASILEDGRISWGPPERRPATIDEEKEGGKPTPSTGETVLPITPTEHESWSNMVATPLVSMFPKGTTEEAAAADGKLPLWNAEGVVPQIGDAAIYRRGQKGARKKNTGPGVSGPFTLNGATPPMPTPTGIVPTSPYNLGMLSAMGLSPEAQLLALQMFVNGIMPSGYVPPAQTHGHVSGGRWRGQSSAGLKSGSSVKSAGPKSASSNGPASSSINREHETDPELLKDIPAWLKALRLHKYAASFEGLTWEQMVVLDEAALESRGVVTVGARKRFLRLFETVKKSQGMVEITEEVGGENETAEAVSSAPVAVATD